MGGKRITVKRPRVRSGTHEVALPTYEHFKDSDPLTKRVLEQVLLGVSARRYHSSLEGNGSCLRVRGTSKSAVSRRFVMATAERIAEWMARPLDGLDIVALFMDGIRVGDHMVVAAIGIDADGRKHALGIWEGVTENSAVCQVLIDNLLSRDFPRQADAVRDRRSQGIDQGDKADLWQECRDPALSAPQDGMSIVRHVTRNTRNVKRWRNGKMVLRWTAIGFMEASKRFRCINGYQEIPRLVAALTRSYDACGSKRKRDLDKSKAA